MSWAQAENFAQVVFSMQVPCLRVWSKRKTLELQLKNLLERRSDPFERVPSDPAMPRKSSAEIVVPMMVDVDGAANAYGPNDSTALDYELNA